LTITEERPSVELVRVTDIVPNPHNPRRAVGDVSGMAASIRALGVLQAVVLHDDGSGTLTCLIGHRRTAGAVEAGLEFIPAQVWRGLSLHQQIEMMLVENLQRENLKPTEEAHSYAALITEGKMSQRQVADRVGCDQSHVSRRLELLQLSEEDQERVDTGELAVSKALKSLKPSAEPKPAAETLSPDVSEMAPRHPGVDFVGYLVLTVAEDGTVTADEWNTAIYPTEQAAWEATADRKEEGLKAFPVEMFSLEPITPSETEPPAVDPAEEVATEDVVDSDPEAEPEADVAVESPVESVDAAPAGAPVTMLVGEPSGLYSLRPVSCSRHGRIASLASESAAMEKAHKHIEIVHAGLGTVETGVAAASERNEAFAEFAVNWLKVPSATEEMVRESAIYEFPDSGDDQDTALAAWRRAVELTVVEASA
jgi:ParB/RepB/Spo0J family partition protein